MNSVLERPIWTAGEKIKDRALTTNGKDRFWMTQEVIYVKITMTNNKGECLPGAYFIKCQALF